MSKQNNRKKDKQEITQNEVHAMAQEWQNSKDDERVLVLFSLSEFGRLRFFVRGPNCNSFHFSTRRFFRHLTASLTSPSMIPLRLLRTKRRKRKSERPAPHCGSASSIGSFLFSKSDRLPWRTISKAYGKHLEKTEFSTPMNVLHK